ncbi:MAG: hypothetical protein ISN29_02395 [Gammaproteobacteria bacterium AqS3]|nr:hypothetical protein [Gammaproteobacteria bacterium AqS3]
MYYIQQRDDQNEPWEFVVNIDANWYREFDNKKDAQRFVEHLREEANECGMREWEYRIKEQKESPWNMTTKNQLHIPQLWREDKQQWRDWELDGREACWFTSLEAAKEWVNDAIDMQTALDPIKTRIQTFDLTNPRISYKKNG